MKFSHPMVRTIVRKLTQPIVTKRIRFRRRFIAGINRRRYGLGVFLARRPRLVRHVRLKVAPHRWSHILDD